MTADILFVDVEDFFKIYLHMQVQEFNNIDITNTYMGIGMLHLNW